MGVLASGRLVGEDIGPGGENLLESTLPNVVHNQGTIV